MVPPSPKPRRVVFGVTLATIAIFGGLVALMTWQLRERLRDAVLRREAEAELLPTCERLGIGVLPYFPLASGLLTGKYRRGEPRPEGTRLSDREAVFTAEMFDRLEALEAFAKERGLTLLQVAIGGLLAQPAISSVIAGSTKPEQVRANVEAANWEATPEDLSALNSLGEDGAGGPYESSLSQLAMSRGQTQRHVPGGKGLQTAALVSQRTGNAGVPDL